MTNFDPGGFLILLTVIPALVAGIVSVGLAHLAARLGVSEYETTVVVVLGVMIAGWIGVAFVVSTGMLTVLAVTLSMVGAYAATRSIAASSYGWVLGVLLLFVAFIGLSEFGIYQGVDRSGRPQGVLARHVMAFYFVGLFLFGVVGGRVVSLAHHVLVSVDGD